MYENVIDIRIYLLQNFKKSISFLYKSTFDVDNNFCDMIFNTIENLHNRSMTNMQEFR